MIVLLKKRVQITSVKMYNSCHLLNLLIGTRNDTWIFNLYILGYTVFINNAFLINNVLEYFFQFSIK